jgi:hypothetical protein
MGASKITENATYAAQVAKSKANEAKVTENVNYVTGSLYSMGSKATETVTNTASSIK